MEQLRASALKKFLIVECLPWLGKSIASQETGGYKSSIVPDALNPTAWSNRKAISMGPGERVAKQTNPLQREFPKKTDAATDIGNGGC